MASLDFEKRKRSEMRLDMTPLIDMVFLLLIFFVLSSHFVKHEGIQVKLPKAVNVRTLKNEQTVVLIDKEGNVYLNDARVGMNQLKAQLKSELDGADSKTVVIKADEEVPLGLAVRVMDIAREANADGLVISAKTASDETKQ